MSRFFFHIAGGAEFPDEEGAVLPDVTAARNLALVSAREMVADDLKQGKTRSLNDRIEVHDKAGRIVAVVTFREAVGIQA